MATMAKTRLGEKPIRINGTQNSHMPTKGYKTLCLKAVVKFIFVEL